MKNILTIFLLSLIFLPAAAFASCGADGYTAVYVNGILTNEVDARKDKNNLESNFVYISGRTDVKFLSGYNQSHLGGAGDLIESASQLLDSSVSNYDLNTILLQIYPEVTTRKILLVGHSQGTFYTNEIYNYLLAHGEEKGALGVYNVATPASFVSGGGAYLTSQNDKVINAVRALAPAAKQPLPANINIPLSAEDITDKFGGHAFSGVYLANAPARIVSEIDGALGKLVAGENQNTADAGCFTPPPENFSYQAQKLAFAVADPVVGGLWDGSVYVATTASDAGNFIASAFDQAVYLSASTGNSLLGNFGGLTLAIFDKFVTTVGPGQTTVGPRSDQAVTSTPSQPNHTGGTQVPAPITASPKAKAIVANNPAPSNPSSSPAVAGTSTSNPNANPPVIFGGVSGSPGPSGVSVSGGSPNPGSGGPTPHDSTSTGVLSSAITIQNFAGAFKSDRLEIDFSWTASPAPASLPKYLIKLVDNGTSTLVLETTSTSASIPVPGYGKTFIYSVEARDAGGNLLSNVPTADVAVPDWFTEIQPVATDESHGSWYDDNWYKLGTGFYGTVYALTFEGGVTGRGDNLQDSTVLLQEYLDSNYSTKNREFVISQGKDFTNEFKQVIIKNLNIPLQPNKYYRLWTSNGLQNAYVALKGTAAPSCDSPCGDAMWNEFVFNQGRTEHIYRFYPFIQAVMQKNFPAQSAPTSPAITDVSFDELGSRVIVSWASSTDADTTDNLIKYEFNYSSSTELSPDGWVEVGRTSRDFPVEFPNSYTFGVRAKDDFGNTSAPTVQNWSFPSGFSPTVLSNSLGSADQNFVLASDGILGSIKVFTTDISTSARFVDALSCGLSLYDVDAGGDIPTATSETTHFGNDCTGSPTFAFGTAPEIISGHHYRWHFVISTGNPSTGASVKFWGKMIDTAGGLFSDPSIVNARFEITDSGGGTLFKN